MQGSGLEPVVMQNHKPSSDDHRCTRVSPIVIGQVKFRLPCELVDNFPAPPPGFGHNGLVPCHPAVYPYGLSEKRFFDEGSTLNRSLKNSCRIRDWGIQHFDFEMGVMHCRPKGGDHVTNYHLQNLKNKEEKCHPKLARERLARTFVLSSTPPPGLPKLPKFEGEHSALFWVDCGFLLLQRAHTG